MSAQDSIRVHPAEAISQNAKVNGEPPQASLRAYIEEYEHVIEQEQGQIKPILELCSTFCLHPKADQPVDRLAEKDEMTFTDLGTQIIAGIMGLKTYEAQMYTFLHAIHSLTFMLQLHDIQPKTPRAMLISKLYMLQSSGRFNATVAVPIPKKVKFKDIIPALIKTEEEESTEWLEL